MDRETLVPGTEGNSTNIQATPKRRSWTSLIAHITAPLLVIIAAAGGAVWMMQSKPQAKPAPVEKLSTLVEVSPVTMGSHTTMVEAMGTVAAARQIVLQPQVSGEIIDVSRNFVPGGLFHKGDALLRIDPTDYQLAIRQLASDVAQAESDFKVEQGNQAVAKREFELLNEVISDQDHELVLRKPQLAAAMAAVETSRARLAQAKVDLTRTTLEAPFNSVVRSREVNLGTRVSSGMTLATLVDTDTYWVEVLVPVNKLRWIDIPRAEGEKGSEARVYDSAAWGEGACRVGEVIRLAADLEEEGRMARLLVAVNDPLALKPENAGQPKMLIGSYPRVVIQGRTLSQAASLDQSTIRDGRYVWVMNRDQRLDIRPVEIAFRGPEQVLVTSGLEDGDMIVTSNIPVPVEDMPLRAAVSDDSGNRVKTAETKMGGAAGKAD